MNLKWYFLIILLLSVLIIPNEYKIVQLISIDASISTKKAILLLKIGRLGVFSLITMIFLICKIRALNVLFLVIFLSLVAEGIKFISIQSPSPSLDTIFLDLIWSTSGFLLASVFILIKKFLKNTRFFNKTLLGIKNKKIKLGTKISSQLLSGSAWAFGAKVGTGIAQIMVGVLLARIISPEDFGQFQVVQRILVLGGILGSFGMGWVIVRFVAEGITKENEGDSYQVAIKIFKIVLTISGLIAIIFIFYGKWLALDFLHISVDTVYFVIAIGIIAAAFQQIIPETFRGMHDIKFASVFSGFAANTLFFISLLLIWLAGNDINFTITVILFVTVSYLTILIAFCYLYGMLKKLRRGKSEEQYKSTSLLKIGTPLVVSTLLSFTMQQADVWIIASWISVEVAAYYASASRIVFVLTVPLMVANAILKPTITELWVKKERKKLERLLRRAANWTLLISIIPAYIAFAWPEFILGKLYGPFYQQGKDILRILSISQIMVLSMGTCGVLIVLAGKQNILFFSSMVSITIFLVSILNLVSMFGAEGVALSVMLGIICGQLIIASYCWKWLGIKTFIGW